MSAICMMLEQPLDDPESLMNKALSIANLILTTIFVLEMVMKIVVYGFLMNGPDSYLMSGWNILDCIIVIVSTVSIIVEEIAKNDPDIS